MTFSRKLHLVLCWHMHQPDYRSARDHQFKLPWTYLHAIKDYTDMAWHLEQAPGFSCVVNLVPSLLEQLEDYGQQFVTGRIRDPLLALLQHEDLDGISEFEHRLILEACFRCNHEKMIAPYPAYSRLYDLMQNLQRDEDRIGLKAYLSAQYLADLLVWYHLAWMGESIRRTNNLITRLMAKGALFSREDRRALFDFIGELIAQIIPRYRALQDSGQVELSTTPAFHPIVPLLLDFKVARETDLAMPLPVASTYPGGRVRSEAQLNEAQTRHLHYFGVRARGMWPSEGALSPETLEVLFNADCQWCATGENVLTNSLRAISGAIPLADRRQWLYTPYRYNTDRGEITCFFRDDILSDKIGFEYAKWNGEDAAQDFIHALEAIYHETDVTQEPVVTIVLDGENAWEYYPYNGYYFLSALYRALQQHSFINPTTFSRCLDQMAFQTLHQEPVRIASRELTHLVSGSWVYGTLSTWIGDPAKNLAWDLLVDAKKHYDRVMDSAILDEAEASQARRQLSICEGSDWFWWFGDYNNAQSVRSFDELYRHNLTNLYHLLKLPAPSRLFQPLSLGSQSDQAGGAMRRTTE